MLGTLKTHVLMKKRRQKMSFNGEPQFDKLPALRAPVIGQCSTNGAVR